MFNLLSPRESTDFVFLLQWSHVLWSVQDCHCLKDPWKHVKQHERTTLNIGKFATLLLTHVKGNQRREKVNLFLRFGLSLKNVHFPPPCDPFLSFFPLEILLLLTFFFYHAIIKLGIRHTWDWAQIAEKQLWGSLQNIWELNANVVCIRNNQLSLPPAKVEINYKQRERECWLIELFISVFRLFKWLNFSWILFNSMIKLALYIL